jgi:NarL family two-component system response regulator LiaR
VTDRTAVVVDPYPLWVGAMEDFLARVGVDVVGRATVPDAALGLVKERRPDLLVVGLEFPGPGPDGLLILEQAHKAHSDLRSVVLAADDDPHRIEAAFAAGATVYCFRTSNPDDLATAIRQVFALSIFFAGPPLKWAASMARPNGNLRELTRRELEILRLVAEGYSNPQLARMLWVTEQTIKFHLSNVYRKLDVRNRTEASRWAQLHGLLPTTAEATVAA